jgi:single-strand DNA-binding protein
VAPRPIFGKMAEIAGEYAKKGALVGVEGELQTKKWQDKDGVDRYSTEIIAHSFQLLGRPQNNDGGDERPAQRPASKPAAGRPAAQQSGGKFDDFEDDIPF